MNVVMIVPTGIDYEIACHRGDANAPARSLAANCETLVLHPNVVNASDNNEMPSARRINRDPHGPVDYTLTWFKEGVDP